MLVGSPDDLGPPSAPLHLTRFMPPVFHHPPPSKHTHANHHHTPALGIEAMIAQYFVGIGRIEDYNAFCAQRDWPPVPIPARDYWHSIFRVQHCAIEDLDITAILEATSPGLCDCKASCSMKCLQSVVVVGCFDCRTALRYPGV